MSAFDHIEKKCFNNEMKNIIIIELCNFDSTNSISLKSVISFTKICFKNLICAFNLIIWFKMMNSKEFYFNAKIIAYLILKVIDKL